MEFPSPVPFWLHIHTFSYLPSLKQIHLWHHYWVRWLDSHPLPPFVYVFQFPCNIFSRTCLQDSFSVFWIYILIHITFFKLGVLGFGDILHYCHMFNCDFSSGCANKDKTFCLISHCKDNTWGSKLYEAFPVVAMSGTIILVPSHRCEVTATHLKMGYP